MGTQKVQRVTPLSPILISVFALGTSVLNLSLIIHHVCIVC